MAAFKESRLEEIMKQAAADFLQRESNRLSLITVTRVVMSDKLSKANIMLTVLPEDREEEALEFARRNRKNFGEYLIKHTKLQRLPSVNFEIDFGEKNRQRIDAISNESQ
jgi:ribosome-binding factor A